MACKRHERKGILCSDHIASISLNTAPERVDSCGLYDKWGNIAWNQQNN